MKIILHIGEGKTGTTSIQQFLSANRENLRDLGVVYHTPPSSVNHVCLAARLGVPVRVSKENLKALKTQSDRLFSQLKSVSENTKYKAIVISVEHIFTASPDVVLAYLSNYFDERSVHVLAYVRDPVSQYVSRMQQRIKASYLIVPPYKYSRDVYSPMKRWVDRLSIDRVHVKPFSRACLLSSDVLVDFLSQLDLIVGGDLSCLVDKSAELEASRSNTGINVEQMSTVQCFRRIVYPASNNVLQRRSSRLVSFFEGLNECGDLGTKPRLKPEISAAIYANNASFIQSLADLFPSFRSLQHSLGVSQGGESDKLAAPRRNYVSIVDLFESKSPHVLNLYRFLCLPFPSASKEPSTYVTVLMNLLARCDSSVNVEKYIRKHVEKARAVATENNHSLMQVF